VWKSRRGEAVAFGMGRNGFRLAGHYACEAGMCELEAAPAAGRCSWRGWLLRWGFGGCQVLWFAGRHKQTIRSRRWPVRAKPHYRAPNCSALVPNVIPREYHLIAFPARSSNMCECNTTLSAIPRITFEIGRRLCLRPLAQTPASGPMFRNALCPP
jgi:hypothetical protein